MSAQLGHEDVEAEAERAHRVGSPFGAAAALAVQEKDRAARLRPTGRREKGGEARRFPRVPVMGDDLHESRRPGGLLRGGPESLDGSGRGGEAHGREEDARGRPPARHVASFSQEVLTAFFFGFSGVATRYSGLAGSRSAAFLRAAEAPARSPVARRAAARAPWALASSPLDSSTAWRACWTAPGPRLG